MKFTRLILTTLTTIAATLAGAYVISTKNHQPYTGPFTWKKVVISERESELTNSRVFYSPNDMREIFRLKKGDECYYLQGEEWIWRDPKDMTPFVPIFCPKYGGGWAVYFG